MQLRCWVIGALLAVGLLGPANAAAGTYVIDNCPSAPTSNGNPGPWTIFGAPQTYKDSCDRGAGDFIGPLGGYMAPASIDGVQVTTPSGSAITISEAEVWWFVPHQSSGADTFARASSSGGVVGESATPDNKSVTPDDFILPSSTTSFILADYCSNDDAGGGCVFGAGENPDLELFGAQLTLSDSSLPSGTVSGGGLAGTGSLSGAAAITYNAQDDDSGVRLVQLLVDGHAVAEHDYLAECSYQTFAACPTSLSGEIQWNTVETTNGTHEVALRVVSAANDELIIDDHTLTIDNQPVMTPTAVVEQIPNGDPCAGPQLVLEVNGKRTAPVVPYGKRVTVEGVLHCGAVPISDARITVASLGDPSSEAFKGSVQTASNGSFSFSVPIGPDRRLQFSYAAYSDSLGASAIATATIAVRPSIVLRITPHNTSNGHTIYWTGRIAGGPYPRGGVTLDVEVQEGRRWRIFDQVVTNSGGEFHYSYRFHATTEATTYKFQVVLPDNGSVGYPYRPGASKSLDVHVAP